MQALVVDPNDDERARLVTALSRRGHSVFALGDHRAALRRLRDGVDVDAVVIAGATDDMAWLTRGIRALPRGDEVFVTTLVAPGQPNALLDVLDAGASDYFFKPLDIPRMDAMLRVAERTVTLAARRSQAEATLTYERDFVATVLDTVASLVVVLDRNGTVVRFNRACEEATGRTSAEVVGKSFEGFVPPDDVPSMRAALERLWAGERRLHYVNHLLTHDGSRRKIEWRNGLLRGTHASDDYIIGTGLDVTDRSRTEAALEESERTLRSFYDSAPLMMGLVEPVEPIVDGKVTDMVYLSCNAALAREFGTTPEEMRGRLVSTLQMSERLVGLWRMHCVEADATGQPERFEYTRGEGADQRCFAATITRTSMDARTLPRFCLIVEDVTERRRLQTRLLLADRMVSVGTLAAGVAHEINNPLTYVIANLEYMRKQFEGLVPADRKEGLDRALSQASEGAERVRQIVRNLRTFSRGDEDRRGPVHVQQVLEGSIEMAWNEIRHRARLIRDYRNVPPVEANEARLGQVFLNLLVNAAQAIHEGNASAHQIRVSVVAAEDNRVVVTIRDTGRGIPKELLGRIFDPFFTTKPVGVGTGLGLSICHGIVTALGGEITVESEVGAGSVFRVSLPPATVAVAPQKQSAPMATAGRRGRVLIVDDEPNLRSSLGQILSIDHDVTTAGSAREALDAVTSGHPYDAILCDLMMPEMSGMELYDELSRIAPEQISRMIFLTGGAFTPRAQDFLDRVPNPRLEKPFDLDQLRTMLRKMVR